MPHINKALRRPDPNIHFVGFKTAMASGDVDGAVSYFTLRSREKYREGFSALSDKLPQIAAGMQNIELIYVHGDVAKYCIYRPEEVNGEIIDISYFIYFRVDTDGLWRMVQF